MFENSGGYGYAPAIADAGATLVYSGPSGANGGISLYFWDLATRAASTLQAPSGGVVTFPSITGSDSGWVYTKHAFVDSNGKLVLVGRNSGNANGFVARFVLGAGTTTLDTTFNGTGVKVLDSSLASFATYSDVWALHAVEDSTGHYVIAGYAVASGNADGWLLRLAASGAGPNP